MTTDPVARARAHQAAALGRLAAASRRQEEALSRALGRSRCEGDAAVLAERLRAHREAAGGPPKSGVGYLQHGRALRALSRALWQAETHRAEADRWAVRGQKEALALLGEVREDLRAAAAALAAELPLDQGMGDRLVALVALIRARREIVPLLAAARPQWKRT